MSSVLRGRSLDIRNFEKSSSLLESLTIRERLVVVEQGDDVFVGVEQHGVLLDRSVYVVELDIVLVLQLGDDEVVLEQLFDCVEGEDLVD